MFRVTLLTFAVFAAATALPAQQRGASTPTQPAAPSSFTFPTHPFYDVDRDGRIASFSWRRYKASFDERGASFVPFFGGDVPRNFPIRFRLDRATVGGVDATIGDAMPTRADDVVSFDRGFAIERYTHRERHVEQSFVIRQLPSRGELDLTIDVATELEMRDAGDELLFENEYGSVSYGRAIAIDALGRSTPVERIPGDGSIRLRVPASFVEDAALPLVVDPNIGVYWSYAINALNDILDSPDVACDENGTSVVVFEYEQSLADHDVWSALFDQRGLIPGSFTAIDISTADWRAPSVAYDRTTQRCCIASRSGTNLVTRRHLMTVPTGLTAILSTPIGAPFVHDIGGARFIGPIPVFAIAVGTPTDVQLLSLGAGSGAIQTTAAPISANNPVEGISVGKTRSSLAEKWGVAWTEDGAGFDDVRVVRWDSISPPFAPTTVFSGGSCTQPSISSLTDPLDNGRSHCLVTWTQGVGDIFAQVVDDLGASVGTPQDLHLLETEAPGFPHRSWPQLASSVDTDGENFTIAYTEDFFGFADFDVLLTTIHVSETGVYSLVADREYMSGTPINNEWKPEIASFRSGGAENKPKNIFAIGWLDQQETGFTDVIWTQHYYPLQVAPSLLYTIPVATSGLSQHGNLVAGFGDIDGDGLDDFGASAASGSPLTEFYSGGGTVLTSILGTVTGVEWAGDVNADGRDDFLVTTSIDTKVYVGAAPNVVLHTLPGSAGFVARGVGDVDADGYDDFAVADPAGGTCTVYSGIDATVVHVLPLGASFASGAVAGGDLDADGFSDIVFVGADAGGNSTVVTGFSGVTGSVILGWSHTGPVATVSIDCGADVDRDGFDDVLVGIADVLGLPATTAGVAYLLSGFTGQPIYCVDGAVAGDAFGTAVALLGDVDGDAYEDFAISSPGSYGDYGGLLVLSGRDAQILTAWFGAQGTFFGTDIDAAGDVNGDGYPELVAGAPLDNLGAGFCFVLQFGQTGDPGYARSFGTPCGAGGRVPRTDASGYAKVDEIFTVELRGAALNANTVLLVGLDTAIPLSPIGLVGCTLYSNPLVDIPLTTDANGMANLPLVIPNDPVQAIGPPYVFQWLTVDPAVAAMPPALLQLTVSDGLRVEVGF